MRDNYHQQGWYFPLEEEELSKLEQLRAAEFEKQAREEGTADVVMDDE